MSISICIPTKPAFHDMDGWRMSTICSHWHVFINFIYKLYRCLQHHHTNDALNSTIQCNDVMLGITSLLVTVDFAASLLYNYILSPLLMVMSLARTAETDMFIEVQVYIFRDTDNDAAYPIVSRNICDFMSTLC